MNKNICQSSSGAQTGQRTDTEWFSCCAFPSSRFLQPPYFPPSFPLISFKSSQEIFFQDSVGIHLIKVQGSLSR